MTIYTINSRTKTSDRLPIRENLTQRVYFTEHIQPRATDRWIDGGAHIGTFSLSIAHLVTYVDAYEPEPDNYRLLTGNLRVNNIRNVTPHPAALVDHEDPTTNLYLAPDPTRTTEHSTRKKRGRVPLAVPAANINHVLAATGANCLKLDIEGEEYDLLDALTDVRWAQLEVITMEAHLWVARAQPRYLLLDAQLRLHGFDARVPEWRPGRPTEYVEAWRPSRLEE